MKSKRVLFINQEMIPYVPESQVAVDGRTLPQAILEKGCEIRTFMPRWGIINERRNQLHEVIRLSGMNIIIDDTDHPLIIKVASIQAARMQVYFIDNEDYFHKRGMRTDNNGQEYADNLERAVFFARGVLETVKKLRWYPDVICCQGWISSVAPFFIKKAYCDEPAFAHARVVSALCHEMPDVCHTERLVELLSFREADRAALEAVGVSFNSPDSLARLAVAFSDGVIEGEAGVQPDVMEFAKERGLPVLPRVEEAARADAYATFFDSLLD